MKECSYIYICVVTKCGSDSRTSNSIVMPAVVIALCRAIRVVRLHDVSMIAIGVEGTD
jgi:hypothetical protein